MLIATLIILNIPVYLLIGWLVFDTAEGAADTFFEAIVTILKRILIPPIIRALMGYDTDEAWGLLPIAAFFIASGAIVYGEYYLITTYLLQSA